MIINIGDIEKVGITHALRVAIGRINSSLATAFNNCHPDRHNLDWYKRVEDDISVMKELKQLLDRLEEQEKSLEKGDRQ
jgi:hypothetical protein